MRSFLNELEVVFELVNKLVKENSKTELSLDEYNKKYEELTNRHEKILTKRDDLINTKTTKQGQALKMKAYLNNIIQAEDELDQWNERIWMLMVESAVVQRDSRITFKLQNGQEVTSK